MSELTEIKVISPFVIDAKDTQSKARVSRLYIPLMFEGATSPMYIGQMADARPTPRPPITR